MEKKTEEERKISKFQWKESEMPSSHEVWMIILNCRVISFGFAVSFIRSLLLRLILKSMIQWQCGYG